MSKEKSIKLTDSAISHLAKLVQIAILTGTDIIDHMRMLEFSCDEDNHLTIEEEYGNRFEDVIKDMLNNAPGENLSE